MDRELSIYINNFIHSTKYNTKEATIIIMAALFTLFKMVIMLTKIRWLFPTGTYASVGTGGFKYSLSLFLVRLPEGEANAPLETEFWGLNSAPLTYKVFQLTKTPVKLNFKF